MPVMDGYEFALRLILVQKWWFNGLKRDQAFRKKKARQECAIVAVTAYNSQDVATRVKEAGMKLVLFKPVSLNHLTNVVNTYYF